MGLCVYYVLDAPIEDAALATSPCSLAWGPSSVNLILKPNKNPKPQIQTIKKKKKGVIWPCFQDKPVSMN